MVRRWGLLWIGLALGILSAGCDQQPKGTPLASSGLKLAVKTGDTHRVRMLREEVLVQGSIASKERLARYLGVDCTFHVVQVDPDGTAHMQVVFNGGIYKQNEEMADRDDLPPIFKAYARPGNPLANIRGQFLLVTLSPDWVLMSVEGLEGETVEDERGLLHAIAKEYQLSSEETKNDALGDFARSWRSSIGYGMAQQIVSDVMDLFPIGFVDRGDQGFSLDGLGIGFVRGPDCTWMVENMNSATVNVRTLAKFKTQGSDLVSRLNPITYELSGTKKGKLEVDKAKGWILRGRIDEKYSGNKVVRMGDKQKLTYPADYRRIIRFEQAKQ